jgi:hypothetical protein
VSQPTALAQAHVCDGEDPQVVDAIVVGEGRYAVEGAAAALHALADHAAKLPAGRTVAGVNVTYSAENGYELVMFVGGVELPG